MRLKYDGMNEMQYYSAVRYNNLLGTGANEKINESLARLVSTVDWFHLNADLLC